MVGKSAISRGASAMASIGFHECIVREMTLSRVVGPQSIVALLCSCPLAIFSLSCDPSGHRSCPRSPKGQPQTQHICAKGHSNGITQQTAPVSIPGGDTKKLVDKICRDEGAIITR